MIRRFAFVALFLTAMSALPACDRSTAGAAQVDAEPAVALGPSIYPLALPLHDEHDRSITLDAFRGHPVVLSMFYASCPSACPLTIHRIQAMERELSPADRASLRILLVSFDSKHDTPEILQRAAQSHGVDDRWDLATGSEDDVRALAAAMGVTYTALPEGGFTHNSVLLALDPEGRPIARVEGATGDTAPIFAALKGRDRS